MSSSILLRATKSCSSRLGIFRSPYYYYGGSGSKLGARMMSVSSAHSSPPPWLMLPPAFEGGGNSMVYKFYSPTENKVFSLNKRSTAVKEEGLTADDDAEIVGSSHGWLALFNSRNCDLFLSNPLTGRHIKLPPIHSLPIHHDCLSGGYACVSKVIISCSPEEGDECRAMMIYGRDRLAFCCPSRSREWTPIGASVYNVSVLCNDDDTEPDETRNQNPRTYEDLVYSCTKKLFFCLTNADSEELEGWDVSDPLSPRLDWSDKVMLKRTEQVNYPWAARSDREWELKFNCRQLRYLVFAEQSDQLFLVTRHLVESMNLDGTPCIEDDSDYPEKTVAFDVHKIDLLGRRVGHVEGSLDGLAMFVGLNHSFAVSAAEFPHQLKPNSIYFTEDRIIIPPVRCDCKYGGHDIGIFDYEKGTISSCYYPCDVQNFKRIVPPPIWFAPTPH
ncbi:hypothetical protein OROGR_031518 [Orobanche gracilis]